MKYLFTANLCAYPEAHTHISANTKLLFSSFFSIQIWNVTTVCVHCAWKCCHANERVDDKFNQYSIFYELDVRNHVINSKRYFVSSVALALSFFLSSVERAEWIQIFMNRNIFRMRFPISFFCSNLIYLCFECSFSLPLFSMILQCNQLFYGISVQCTFSHEFQLTQFSIFFCYVQNLMKFLTLLVFLKEFPHPTLTLKTILSLDNKWF